MDDLQIEVELVENEDDKSIVQTPISVVKMSVSLCRSTSVSGLRSACISKIVEMFSCPLEFALPFSYANATPYCTIIISRPHDRRGLRTRHC